MKKGHRTVIQAGTLGHFYDCLKTFRSISTKRVPEGQSINYRLYISDLKYFELSMAQNEAYIISFTEREPTGERLYKTSVKAINCSLSLLEAISSNSSKNSYQ